ncbi:ABC transporter ATP-binding protein [Leucobacter sp. M11]|uniref:ABC transporter ATP-binding protein n=1 Tax=Leucobacter sp. M11 TaxID=2993565 RepID=UPI002D7E4D21|nr:ATP-binding cassette domain-containing protein [Leucobacter sp. M11]MEB4615555.1 ATP-binding cassette domain-containing protein [Leucobacter sp. M11]
MSEQGTERRDPVLLEGRALVKRYRQPSERLFRREPETVALNRVSLAVREGESVAIVGESGSGKTTLLKQLLGLETPDAGEVRFAGTPVVPRRGDRMLWLRRNTGIVFQDPYSSLNPRMPVGAIVAEPLGALDLPGDHRALVIEMLERVGLPADTAERYPNEFSGGQRQRIALARALVHGPRLLVGDEPVSALDVLVRQRILAQLTELRQEMGLTLLTVTHDLGIVRQLAERLVVMRRGEIVEAGPIEDVLTRPEHPYTQQLIAAVPTLPRR